MKRDPLSIISLLIQTLETFNENQEYNFNEISNRSSLHWETVKRYIYLIKHIQNLAPLIEIEENKIKIIKKILNTDLETSNKLLLTLFYSKAFNENSAIDLLDNDNPSLKDIINSGLIQETATQKFYLTDSGKRNAFKIYRQNSDTIYEDYLKLHSNLPVENMDSRQDLDDELSKLRSLVITLENQIKQSNSDEIEKLRSKVSTLENQIEKLNNLQIPLCAKPPEESKKSNLVNSDAAWSSQTPKIEQKYKDRIYG